MVESEFKSVVRRITRPIEALERTDFALADRMPDLGATLFTWLGELGAESDDVVLQRCRELVEDLDSLPGEQRRSRLREFARLWRGYIEQEIGSEPQSWSLDDLAGRPLLYEKGVGPARFELLKRLNLFTVADLLTYRPRDYQDRSHPVPLKGLRAGEEVTVIGELRSVEFMRGFRGRKSRLVALLTDGTDHLVLTWFNPGYLVEKIKPGRRLVAFGRITPHSGGGLVNPDFEFWEKDKDPRAFGRIVPIYSLTSGLGQRFFRLLTRRVLDFYLPGLQDHVPDEALASQ
ncbi:hypothetical protein KAU45_05510, partial [bacterium]|nr:hypothetical protein [bacterium]